ncbi:MAG: hypothetical protein ACOYT4_02620 [Nanoarchaeota archaeon]
MKFESLFNQILKNNSLSDKEFKDLKKRAEEIIKKVSNKNLKLIIGGSLAKSTIIRKELQDIDIFAVFEKEEDTLNLEKILRAKLTSFDIRKVHGSRDYFQIKEGQIIFEIIPVVKVKNKPNNITDLSLSHVKYIKDKIKKNPKLPDEIKLAKMFCHAQNCYGAESYINGFSGYALEILISYYGSFLKFLKSLDKKQNFVDPAKYYKNKEEAKLNLNENKLQSPIILIDPTYKYRNACGGLSYDTFEKFKKASIDFLKKPDLKFFEKRELDVEKIKKLAKKRQSRFISIELRTEKQDGDIAGTKMKKFSRFILDELERKQQKVLFDEFDYKNNTARFFLIVKEKNEIEIKGPPVSNKIAVENFKKKRRYIFEKNDYIYTKEKIELKGIFNFIKKFEKDMDVEFSISENIL